MRHNDRPASTVIDDPRLGGYLTFHGDDPFEEVNGPFCWKVLEDGSNTCAFIVARKNLNDDGMTHGGCLMAFADFAIFRFTEAEREGKSCVTLSFASDFTSPGYEGDFIESTGEVIHTTGGMVFVRGDVFCMREGKRVVLMPFTATIKKLRS